MKISSGDSKAYSGLPQLYYFEAVDEQGKRKPDGEPGFLCITHLDRRGTCLLRYLVGDIVAVSNKPCPICGRNDQRIVTAVGSTYGTRTKELLKVKRTLINPEVMRDAVANTNGVMEYKFIISKEIPNDPYAMDKPRYDAEGHTGYRSAAPGISGVLRPISCKSA
jgi:phenylacetate-CoA ligase